MTEWIEIADLWPLWILFASLAVLGAYLAVRALRAYRQRRSRPLLLLSSGIAVLLIGMPFGWTATYLASGSLFWCTLASALASLAGAGLLVTSVHLPAD